MYTNSPAYYEPTPNYDNTNLTCINYDLNPTYIPVYHNSFKQYEPHYTYNTNNDVNIPLYIPTPEVIEVGKSIPNDVTNKTDQRFVLGLTILCFIFWCIIGLVAILINKYK